MWRHLSRFCASSDGGNATTSRRTITTAFSAAYFLLALLLLLLTFNGHVANAARQNPLKDPKICGRPQCELNALNKKFNYKDVLYKYDYIVNLRTEFSGTGENTSDLILKANLEIFFPKPCEGFLRINQAYLLDKETTEAATAAADDDDDDESGTTKNYAIDYDYYGEFAEANSGVGGGGDDDDGLFSDIDKQNLHPKSADLGADLKKNLLRFAFHDGLISEVCPIATEPAWVLNIKKGILSAFQNTMIRFDVDFNTTETDVSGECHVQYSLEGTQDVYVLIHKIKDLRSCRSRHSTHSILQTTPYTFREEKTIWPILNSESYCNMTVDNSLYREINCYERHQLIPFSNTSTGAVTTSTSKFVLKGEEVYSVSQFLAQTDELIEKRSTLLFDHTPAVKPTHGEIKASRDLLKEMCALGFPNIQRDFIDVYTNFLQTTKSLDYKALSQLLARSAGICENGKNHVLESLPYIGSTASYQVMRDQIVSNTIAKDVARNWMTSLSFIQRPDEETLDTFFTILEFSQKKIDPEYTLGAAAVIHNFCKHNSDCALNLKVQRIINLLETEFLSLFNMYHGERRTRERMIVILKSLGNIGVISNQFAKQLQRIIVDEIVPFEIRLHAVIAFRRVDCLQYRQFFMDSYANFSLNSEIRIFNYLQAMRCPDYKSMGVIKTILENEEINQVGSFVWSHLKNLAKSSSPIRIEVQGLLLNDDLSDKFRMDIRKFSRNYEHSLFFDEFNFGSTTDMNLIFGTDSYLPRMTTLNFTADLFGQSVNFFEFSARAEGFEELVTSMFGPKGPLNREMFRKKLSFLNRWIGSDSYEVEDNIENILSIDNLRLKRGAIGEIENDDDVDRDMNDATEDDDYNFEEDHHLRTKRAQPQPESRKRTLQRQVDDLGYKLKYNYNNPRAQIGLRIFGNDVRHYSLEGLMEVMALAKEFDPFYQAQKILSGKEVTYSKSHVFLDASYNVPLAIGLPLSIHAFGASSVDLRISGNLERMESISDWHFDVSGRFKPSVSVDVITTMQSDMYYANSGIKVKSNLYSNSEVEAKVKVRGKNLVSLSFNLPQDTNEIFSARSELLVMKTEQDVPQAGIEHRISNTTCTWPMINDGLGLKMCSYFSVPNLSKSRDVVYPGLLLSGPVNMSLVLNKADLTAKKYVFEYKWDQQDNDSNWSFVFHTPGTAVRRILVANVTTQLDAFNASWSFVSGASKASAGCNYDGKPDHRKLDFFLDTNGNRSLDLKMELMRWQDRTAWVYKPKMILSVNGVNITGLVGAIRINSKNGITQNDIELSFETRKLQALIRGDLVQTEVTTSTNMSVNYRFQANKVETINFEGKLTNTGDRSKTEYRGNVQLKTSAYPKLNFATNATWLTVQGHTEGLVTYNNAPNLVDPYYTSSMRIIFARAYSDDFYREGLSTRASFEVKVPRSRIDFRILLKHEERSKNGTAHNFLLGLRYAPEKEATGLFSIFLPRRNLLAVDAYMNVTIPDFNSCTARLKLTEKTSKDYMINLNGSWFTGHSVSVKGNYKDKSSRVQALHQLKLIVESPSFEVTSLNIVYRRNQLLVFADVQTKFGQDPYGLTVQYASDSDNKNSHGEIRFKVRDKDYWINARLLAEQPKLLQIELHFDKVRDVHIKLGILMLEQRKELSMEFKWDVNRDPAQRLGLLAELNSPGGSRYDGNVMVTYPDRTISCGFELHSGGPKYYGTARASWSVSEMIVFTYNAALMPGEEFNNWLNAELTTPFDGWRRNSFQAGIYNYANLLLANTSLLWADDQNLELGYKSDYNMEQPVISFDIRFGINSTIKDIPTINVKVKHWQDLRKFESDIHLRYSGPNDTLNVYSVLSNWELFQNERFQNLSGTMLMLSPFVGYHKGGLAAKFSLSDQREVSGAASLNFDIREFTFAMNGYVKKFTDNMLTINITTPLEKFRTINGRFGLNEYRHHAVAEVRAPTAALGAEALCDITSLMNFDVKLSVATPIENFQQAAIFAKIKSDIIDMRGKWNNLTLGFTGVWRMANLSDFEYSYQVFTPLVGFEDNGFTAKFIKRDIFQLEFRGKFSHYKLGLKVDGQPKTQQLKQLGSNIIELEILYDNDFKPPELRDTEDYDLDDIDYNEFFSYFVDFELDTIVWPTVDGVIDIQEVLDYYLVVGYLQLPQGRVNLKDRLYYPDYLNVLNVLNLNTPFPMAKEVKTIFEYHVDLDFNFFYDKMHLALSDGIGLEPKEMGFELNYTKVLDTLKPGQHNVQLSVTTPLDLLRKILIEANLEMEDSIYRGNISSKTPNTYLSLAGAVESEDNFLETSIGMILKTNVVPFYASRVYFKKDYTAVDNTINLLFEVTDDDIVNRIQFDTAWHQDPAYLINANGKLRTTILPLKSAETAISITSGAAPELVFDLGLLSRSGYRLDYGARAHKRKDVFNVELWTPMQNYKNISMRGSIVASKADPNEYTIDGHLYRNMGTYGLNGIVRMEKGTSYPNDARLRVQPKTGGRDGVIELSITEAPNSAKGVNFQFSAIEDGKMCQISGGYSINDETGVDFSMLLESTEPEIARISANGKLQPQERGRMIGEFSLETPWKQLGIESVKLRSDIAIRPNGGRVKGEYIMGGHNSRATCAWTFVPQQDMQLKLDTYSRRPNTNPRTVHANLKYQNPNKNFQRLLLANKLNLDSKWNLELNGTVSYRSVDDVQIGLVTRLPTPVGDVHHLDARYSGNIISQQLKDPNIFIETKYKSDEAQRKLLSRISYRNLTDLQGLAHVEWGVANDMSVMEGDFQMLRKPEVRREFYAKLITPQYKDQSTFFLSGNYDFSKDQYHNLVCAIDCPASRRIADMDVTFQTFSNMHGYVNSSTPFLNVTWLKTDFNFTKRSGYCRGTWPTDSAYFDLQSNFLDGHLQGTMEIEIPLENRHRADIKYDFLQREYTDNGSLKVDYNGNQVLNGLYTQLEENRDPYFKYTTDIKLENDFKPLGVHYVNTRDFSNPSGVSDVKHVEVFELDNTKKFNLTGELHVRSTLRENEFKVVVIHPNRTIVLTTNYEDVNEHIIRHHSKVELSQNIWIGYNIELGNNTTVGNESQNFLIELSYPKRILSSEGWYYTTDDRFHSDVSFSWTPLDIGGDKKTVRTALLWQNEPLRAGDRDHQTILFTLGHPYLEKDATLSGTYYRGAVELLKTHFKIDYSNKPEHLIEGGLILKDLYSELGHTNYTFNIFANHEASELSVQMNGTAAAQPAYYKAESYSFYKRDYFPEQHGRFLALFDLNKKEVEYIRNTPYRSVRFWAIPNVHHPIYGMNATIWDTPDTNNTGYAYVDLQRLLVRMEVNLTEDSSQNLQMVGYIPDSRGGYLDVWRNYEEIRIIDISSYLKINHSRLITGRFHWRPKIRDELKNKVQAVGASLYNSVSDGIDFWIKSLYTESVDAVGAVWETSKEYNQNFFDDISELSVLEQDLDDLRIFMNESYEANDFYIKTVVNFTLTILDELAIRDHIESLPKIVTEIWQAMGDSGIALRNSVVWLIETLKKSYTNMLDAISRFFHGESLQYISALMEKGMEKYDKFVKDLHISFIKYVERLWNRFWSMMSIYWHSVLKRIEPYVFKLMSYIETRMWELSKEVFDFIYKRTNELAESPYFNEVSSFTQDVDMLYRDIKGHDAITNIRKYSVIAWDFIKDKYFKLVPFGAELNEVLTEIWDEIKELEKIDQVQLIMQRYNELLAKLDWIAEELQLEMRLHQLYALLRNKLRNYAMNAIDTADMYREAKTKFIFDPEVGVIDLEQKLPMSWHAFNETPKFEEIPEYRFLAKAQNIIETTNSSIVRYIYNLRTHLDPKTWLPPYQSRGLLIDSRHYMTFDKRFVGLNLNFEEMSSGYQRNAQCSYLLAHDFFMRNFTLMLEPSTSVSNSDVVATRKLTFIANGHLIEIDLGNDSITVNGNSQTMLPLQLGDVTIHRDLDVLLIYSNDEFSLTCNVQFDLCWFEVSGWYFGQTAGLLGTMNNEYFDEFTSSKNTIVPDVEEFTDSWSMQRCKQKKSTTNAILTQRVVDECDQFFKSGMLAACADAVDMKPFYEICLDLGTNSNPVREGHPAVKGACTAALAYIEACSAAKIPMRVPQQCVFCQLTNGSYVPEGTFLELSGKDVPHSSDIVFIVEAKPCNANLTQSKNIMAVVATLEEQLHAHNIVNNRYAVMAFGGHAPFDKPRTIIHENRVFDSDFKDLEKHFAHIQTSNGTNNDVLQAISSASSLNFRPGVSKTFILISCSDCAARHMRFDYTSILQYMLEEGVNFHILADTEFDFEKTRKLRHFFGLDRNLVYSKRFPEGDADTRRQLFIPKNNLGICAPLALETDGSIFSARKLMPERKYPIKRFATIFGKRIAKSAVPNANQTCECSGHNTGVAYMACSPSAYPEEKVDLGDYDMDFNDWEWDDEDEEMDD